MATLTERQPVPRLAFAGLRVPILDRYLLGEMVRPFVFAFSAFLLFWALNIFFAAADYIINQHAPFFLVLRFVIFRIPPAIPMAFPFACLFAGLLAMARVTGDNEVIAMRTSGITLWRIALTPLLFGFAMFVVSYATNEWIAPASAEYSTRTFYQIIYHTNALPVEPQFFTKDPDTGNVFFITQILPDRKTMQGVQVYKPARYGAWSETLQAKTATVDHSALILHDVIDTRYNADGYVVGQQKIADAAIGLPLAEAAAQFMTTINSDASTTSSKQLSTQVQAMQAQGVSGTALGNLQVNLANKLAWPFASFIGVVIAVPLALRFGKRGRTIAIALAIAAFFVYYLMSSAGAALGRNAQINPYLAAWLPNIIMGTAGLLLLWLEER
ncbi:MAG TPA: LptF/LptG family permease [Candidatus Aquilonibacter sp.]|nr:LptF/LptG family permease [Candidatus Aquilonibacter sp.]